MPDQIEFEKILLWQKNIGERGLLISDRIKAYRHRAQAESLYVKMNWVEAFREVLEIYNKPHYSLAERKAKYKSDKADFEVLLFPFVDFACEQLKELLSKSESSIQFKSLESSIRKLLHRLSQTASYCFGVHYDAYLKQHKTLEGPEAFFTYCSDFYKGNVFEYFEKYSVLSKALTLICLRWVKTIEKLIIRFESDRPALIDNKILAPDAGIIFELVIDGGITHAHTGPTVIIHFENSRSLVYKTKSSVNEQFFDAIIGFLNELEDFNLKPYCTIDKGDYSWHEFIPYRSCNSIEEVQDYYFRIGLYSSLMQILSSKDYHYGNIIAYGSQPVFIDHETLFDPFGEPAEFSFRRSNILASIRGNDLMDETYLLGAFHSKAEIEVRRCTLDDALKPENRFSRELWKGQNIAMIAGNQVEPLSFTDDIIRGYDRGLNILADNRGKVLNFIKSSLADIELQYRYIPRPSVEYFYLLIASLQEDALSHAHDRNILIDKLFSIRNREDAIWKFCVTECESQLLNEFLLPRFFYCEKDWCKFGLNFEIKSSKAFYDKVRSNLNLIAKESNISDYVEELKNYFEDLF